MPVIFGSTIIYHLLQYHLLIQYILLVNVTYCKTLIFHCILISHFRKFRKFAAFLFLVFASYSILLNIFVTSIAACTGCKMITCHCTVYENVEVEC